MVKYFNGALKSHLSVIIINFFRRFFSECTEANATSLIPLDTILPEICAFIIGFSYTVWTKMRSLAGSLDDGVLADAILIPPHPPILPTNIRMVRGPQKVRKLVTQKPFTTKWKKGDVGMAKRFSKKYANKGWAFKSESYVKMPVSA